MIGLGLSNGDVAVRARGIDPAAAALIARMTAAPDPARAALIEALIVAIKAAGIWSKLDALWVLAAHDAQAARLNWIADGFNLSAVNAPAFTANRGYTGNGSSSYLDSGFNAATAAGARFVQNSAHLGVWCATNVTASASVFGGGAVNSFVRPRVTGNKMQARVNQSASSDFGTGSIATSAGHSIVLRTGAGGQSCYRDASLIGSDAVASAAPTSGNVIVLGNGSTEYSTVRVAAAHLGGGLSGGEVSALYAAIAAYVTTVGA